MAVSTFSGCEEVVVIPRLMPRLADGGIPHKITYVTQGLNSKIRYVWTVFRTLLKEPKFDLVIFGHIHLLSLAFWMRRFFGLSRLYLVLYGVDAWTETRHRFANLEAKTVEGVISISEVTLKRFLAWAGSDGGRKTFLLPPAIRVNVFEAAPDQPTSFRLRDQLRGKKVIMSLSRLSAEDRYKGFDEVIELMP